jgi:exodeoxyribonuclease VII large subunit
MASRRTSGYGPPVPSDAAPGGAPESAIAVRTLTTAAKDLIEGAFPPLWVRGEVTNFKAHRNGHWYFSLRDAEAQVNCVIWSSAARRLPGPPDEGMQVLALGQMTVWPVRGDLQFSVSALEAEGDGLWQKALEQTRLRLEKDGLLDPARKRALPAHPRRIAVITSPDGAALHDIITVARSRSAEVEVVLIPATVQGEGAPESLIAAILRLGRWRDADLLIIGRGGGSREDLWAFNDERVARALAGCPVPTISAVGHETDISIADLVADVRAATPSAAAEMAVPSRRELAARVDALGKRLAAAARRRETLAGQLHALSPLSTLARGFAVARTPAGATLSSYTQFVPGAPFDLWLRDGIVAVTAGDARPLPNGMGDPTTVVPDVSTEEDDA